MTGIGHKFGNNKISLIAYSDDIVIVAENEDDLRSRLASQKHDIQLSITKTQQW